MGGSERKNCVRENRFLFEGVYQQATAQFRFEPRTLGGHDFAGIGNLHQLIECGGVHGNADGPVAGNAQPFKFCGASNSADKINAGIRADIFDAEDWLQYLVFKDGDIERSNGVIDEERIGSDCEAPPFVIDEETEGSRGCGARTFGWLQISESIEAFQKLTDSQSIEISDDAIVGHDAKLCGREQDGEEPVAFFVAGASVGQPAAQLVAGPPRTGGPVVTIGNVEDRHGTELTDEVVAVCDTPDRVLYAVDGGEVVKGLLLHGLSDLQIDGFLLSVGQKHGSGVGIECQHMASPIIFLAAAGFFVFQNQVVFVVIDVDAADDTHLRMLALNLAIGEQAVAAISCEDSVVHQPIKVLAGLVVDFLRVGVVCGWKVDIRPHDVQEAEGISGSQFSGFVAIDNVVGYGGHECRLIRQRSQGIEWFDPGHGVFLQE